MERDTTASTPGPQVILGWREWVVLPGVGIPAMRAKLDTGARSSALHVCEMETYEKRGERRVRFVADYDPRDTTKRIESEAVVVDERIVRDSGGRGEMRIIIRTPIVLAGREWPIDLSLTSRADMRFRMLVGREALRDRVVVDPSRGYLGGRRREVRRMQKRLEKRR